MSLSASTNEPTFGQSVTFTATDNLPNDGYLYLGDVDANDTYTLLGYWLTGQGEATLTTSSLPAGSNTITAGFDPDPSNDSWASSSSITVEVGQAATTTAVTGLPTSVELGQWTTLTASVSRVSPGSGTPSGSIDFYDTTTNTDLVPPR